MSGHIVAIGGAAFDETGRLRHYILGLARTPRPRVRLRDR
jgi:hypothetical protein